jgi:hypothetical protein
VLIMAISGRDEEALGWLGKLARFLNNDDDDADTARLSRSIGNSGHESLLDAFSRPQKQNHVPR